MSIWFSARQFFDLGNDKLRLKPFRSHFGTSPRICQVLWRKISGRLANGARPEHLLWALLFMKVYATEVVLLNLLRVCRNTFRDWVWEILGALHALEGKMVSFCFLYILFFWWFFSNRLIFFHISTNISDNMGKKTFNWKK